MSPHKTVKFDHLKELIEMYIDPTENVAHMKSTLNHFFYLDGDAQTISHIAYFIPYITLIDGNDMEMTKVHLSLLISSLDER